MKPETGLSHILVRSIIKTTSSGQPKVTMEWWEKGPKGICVVCKKKAEKSCRGCGRFFYCSDPHCSETHAETHQGYYCKTHKYLKQDETVLLNNMVASELSKIMPKIAKAQLERTKANTLFTKKNYQGAIDGYKRAVHLFEKIPNTPKTKDWLKASLGRVYANLAVCYMELNRSIMLDAIPTLVRPDIERIHLPLHESSTVINEQKTVQCRQGTEAANRLASKRRVCYALALDAAEKAVQNAPYWYKSHYRLCQVSINTLQPRQAMEAYERAQEVVDLSEDVLYDPRTERKSANMALGGIQMHVKKVLAAMDPEYRKQKEKTDGSFVCFFGEGLTQMEPDHPRAPMSQMGPEILAVRMFAAILGRGRQETGNDSMVHFGQSQAGVIGILNRILTLVSGPPLELFPADGSDHRVPPITVSLIAFYLRCAVAPKLLEEMDVEHVVREVTSWMSDEEAYCAATYNFQEMEDKHSRQRGGRGHATTFSRAGQENCMPCLCRLLRSGCNDWAEGIQMAAHTGSIDTLCFFLNRILEGIDGETPVKAILKPDRTGCNAMMHAANDTVSGFSGLSIRLLAHAASFQGGDGGGDYSHKNVRLVLNTPDCNGYSPAVAATALHNEQALSAFVGLRAKLYSSGKMDKKEMKSSIPVHKQMAEFTVQSILENESVDRRFINLVRSIHSNTHDHASCSYCGRPPKSKEDRLLVCSRCQRGRYCNATCQKADYKRHKYICTAKVERDAVWFVKNMQMEEL